LWLAAVAVAVHIKATLHQVVAVLVDCLRVQHN
jgi:hypothetical protein